jgi:hypothetical protein
MKNKSAQLPLSELFYRFVNMEYTCTPGKSNPSWELAKKIHIHPDFSLTTFSNLVNDPKNGYASKRNEYIPDEKNRPWALWWGISLEEKLEAIEKSLYTPKRKRTFWEKTLFNETEFKLNIPATSKANELLELLNNALAYQENISEEFEMKRYKRFVFRLLKAALTNDHPFKIFLDKL